MNVSLADKAAFALEPELRIYLLGEPYLMDVKTNKVIAIPARCISLLAFLLLNRKPRLRQTIATALWPDLSYSEGRANVRRHLFQLLRALPEGSRTCVKIERKHLEWNRLAPVWCDIEAFDRTSEDERTFSEALEVYGGDLLHGDESEWLVEHRNRLREKHLTLLGAVAEAKLRSGDSGGAAISLRRLLAIDPFREDAFRSLFVLRSASGDRAGATSEYRAFVRLLGTELGVEPMAETIACYESVVR
jgi:DNA-binding SARP family transcriptional activator